MKRLLIALISIVGVSTLHATPARQPISKDELARLEKTPRNRDEIRELLKLARSNDPVKKQQALERISSPDASMKAVLGDTYIDLLDDSDPDLQQAAIQGISTLNDARAKGKIRKILNGLPRHELRSGRDMTPAAMDEHKRAFTAARALAKMGDTQALDEVLDRKSLAVSWPMLMPDFGNAAIPKLVAKVKRGTELERFHALRSIEAMKDASSIGEVKKLLSNENPEIKRSAAIALAHADSPEALRTLDEIYPTLDKDAKAHFAQACIKRCAPARAKVVVGEYLESPMPSEQKMNLISVMGESNNADWIPLLESQLKDKNSVVRSQAACQLAKLTGKLYEYKKDGFTRLGEQECPYIKALKEK